MTRLGGCRHAGIERDNGSTRNLADQTEQPLRATAIVTTTANTIGGPGLVSGQLDRYKTVIARGTAKSVRS